jgi:hypothetical protein
MAELRIEIAGDRIPGAAPVSEHSQFSSVAEASPAIANVIALPSTDLPGAAEGPRGLYGRWRNPDRVNGVQTTLVFPVDPLEIAVEIVPRTFQGVK